MVIFAFYSEGVCLHVCECVCVRRRRRNHFFFLLFRHSICDLEMRSCVGVLLSRQDGLYWCLLSDLNIIWEDFCFFKKNHFDKNEQTPAQVLKTKVKSTSRTLKKPDY